MFLGWQNWWHSVAHLSKTKAVSRNLGDFPQCVYCGSSCTMSVQHMFSVSDMSSNGTCELLSAEADRWQSHPWQMIAFYFMCLMLSSAWCSLVSGQQEECRRLVTSLAPILLCDQTDPGLHSSALLVCFLGTLEASCRWLLLWHVNGPARPGPVWPALDFLPRLSALWCQPGTRLPFTAVPRCRPCSQFTVIKPLIRIWIMNANTIQLQRLCPTLLPWLHLFRRQFFNPFSWGKL